MTLERRLQLLSLQWHNYQLRRHDHREKQVVSYSAVRQIGILFRAPEKEQAKGIDLLIQGLLSDNKSVTAFTFLDDEPSPECSVPFKSFRPSDFDRLGKIKMEVLNRFLDAPLDYLLCISPDRHIEFEHILLRSHALCRMGTNGSAPDQLFEVTFQTDATKPVETCAHVLKYLRMLKGQYQRPAYLRD